MPPRPKRREERISLVVGRGCLIPSDDLARERLRAKGYRLGDEVFATLRKPRNPKFHRLAHALGALVADNVDDFAGMNPHRVLKRLQMECGEGCEEITYKLAGQTVIQRIPLSLAFESMEQGEFEEVFRALCRHLTTYWHGLEARAIEAMAECFTSD